MEKHCCKDVSFKEKIGHQYIDKAILKDVLALITRGNLCHQITKNAQGEVEIEECQELSCDHEEADTRLLLHSKHAAAADFENVVIRSPDTDVFILLLGHNQAIQSNLYFDTGSGNQRRIINVSAVHSSLGLELCDALIAFHAFTGEKRKVYILESTAWLSMFADIGQ